MQVLKRGLMLVAFLGLGVAAGLVVAGRFDLTSLTSAQTASPQAPPVAAPIPISGGLPDLSVVAERAIQSSVNISSTQLLRVQSDPFMDYFYGRRGGEMIQPQQSLGSGVIVSEDGYILTNNHVIGDDSGLPLAGIEIKVTLPDGREVDGTIVGTDSATDLALVKVEAKGLTPVTWGDSSKLRVAQWVLAIGNPYQFNQSVSLGIVSALARAEQYVDFIQTDAAINPGNSGGALVNAQGELVGINTQIFTQSGGYEGIGFAIPANLARAVMDDLIKFGEVRRGSIVGFASLRPLTADEARDNQIATIPGVLVYNLYRNSTAAKAGFQRFDLIVAINGRDVTDLTSFSRLVSAEPIGSTAKVDVVRKNRRITLDVPIEQMPSARR